MRKKTIIYGKQIEKLDFAIACKKKDIERKRSIYFKKSTVLARRIAIFNFVPKES